MQTFIRSLRSLRALALASFLAVAATGCMDEGPRMYLPDTDEEVPSRLSKAEATIIAEAALIAFNENDFEGFSASWDADMRAMVKESDFAPVRARILEDFGHFVEILEVRKTAPVAGYVRFTFLCAFDAGEIIYYLAFPQDGTEASAAYIGPPAE